MLVFKVWVICFPLALNYIIQTFRILTQAGSQPRISVNQLFAQLGPGVHTGYWPSVRLRWLDIGCLWTEIKSRSVAMQKKNKANIQPSWPNKLGQYRIYYNGIKYQKMIFDLAGPSEKSWAGSIAPLACLGSQSQPGIWFILPTHWASHIIKVGTGNLLLGVTLQWTSIL